MGKGPSSRRRSKKPAEMPLIPAASSPSDGADNSIAAMVAASKRKKKAGGARLWMRFDRSGQSELIECDKSMIIKRASIPARDLRILGPVFSHSSSILGDD